MAFGRRPVETNKDSATADARNAPSNPDENGGSGDEYAGVGAYRQRSRKQINSVKGCVSECTPRFSETLNVNDLALRSGRAQYGDATADIMDGEL